MDKFDHLANEDLLVGDKLPASIIDMTKKNEFDAFKALYIEVV